MRIIIVGGGVVGSSLAEKLLRDNHTLSLIETDPALCQALSEKHDLKVITGSGSSPRTLHDAGVSDADLVLAVTPNDEVNLLVCAFAAQHGVARRIARLRNRDFTQGKTLVDLEKLGVTDVIHPEEATVDHIMQFVETPHAIESANFEDGRVLLRGYRVRDNMPLAGRRLKDIRQEIEPAIVLFAAIVRDGAGMIPDGSTEILGGDIVYALFPREATDVFLRLVGIERKKNRRLIVTGDSYALLEMASAVQDSPHRVTFVNPDRSLANQVAESFGNIEVIHGDCTDVELLKEINIETAAFFIGLSTQADYNILSALLAKAEGAGEVIVTATESRHDQLFRSIGIDHVVNPRLTAAREILEIISRGQLGAAVALSDIDIEAVRYIVNPTSQVVGKPVRTVARKLKRGTIFGVIVRGDSFILPSGDTVIEADDHIIVVTKKKNLPTLNRLFKG